MRVKYWAIYVIHILVIYSETFLVTLTAMLDRVLSLLEMDNRVAFGVNANLHLCIGPML
jgi:hypothetical protein